MSGKSFDYALTFAGVGAPVLGLAGCVSCVSRTGFAGTYAEVPFNLITGAVFGLIAGALIGAAVGAVADQSDARSAEQEAEAARRAAEEAERQRYVEQQRKFASQLVTVNEEALSAFESMPGYLERAEHNLDNAETNFSVRAFAPFWDCVEHAAKGLGLFDEKVRAINKCSATYVDLVKQYRGRAPVFAVSSEPASKLRIASETSKRMHTIVDRAQRDFQFSVIYEQRKTNTLLVAGFTTLAHAIQQMTWQITSSVDSLTDSVERMGSTMNESLLKLHEQGEDIAAHTAGLREDFQREAESSGARQKKALEMLDNIQRKRYPSVIHGGLR